MTRAILAIDVGETRTMACAFSATDEMLFQKLVASDLTSRANAFQVMTDLIDEAQQVKGLDITAIAVDAVGQVDPASGTWFGMSSLIKDNIPLAAMLQERYQLPCFALNKVYAAAFAELTHGIGQDSPNFVYLDVATHIAGRVVNHGRIINGTHQYAGEFGHTVVDFNSPIQCTCGRYGCVETFASATGMSNVAKRLIDQGERTVLQVDDTGCVTMKQIMSALSDGDAVAEMVVEQASRGIATLIANLIRAINPAAVVVGGYVVENSTFALRVTDHLDPEAMRLVDDGVTRTKLDWRLMAALGAVTYAQQQLRQ